MQKLLAVHFIGCQIVACLLANQHIPFHHSCQLLFYYFFGIFSHFFLVNIFTKTECNIYIANCQEFFKYNLAKYHFVLPPEYKKPDVKY